MSEIERIKSIVAPIAKKHGVEKVWLFGSRARGDANPDSDYDFLISRGQIQSLWDFAGLWDDLEEALSPKVDIVTDTAEDQAFIEKIRKDEVMIYG